MPSNYYRILGIEREADPAEIKRAYRDAIKRYHPDGGGGATDPHKFIQAREAYEVLSNRDRRRAYDARLKREGVPVSITNLREDLVLRRRAQHSLRDTASPLEAFFESLLPGYHRTSPRRLPVLPDLFMEMVLTPEEALHGGRFPVSVPTVEPCPDCRRVPPWETGYCTTCRNRGAVRSRRSFHIDIPPKVHDGTSAELALDAIGLPGVRLEIHIRVQPRP